MKAEFTHVQNILVNTISLLCKNSLTYQQGMKIHGLLGITLDEEVFLVEISEQFLPVEGGKCNSPEKDCSSPVGDILVTDIVRTKHHKKRSKRTSSTSLEYVSELTTKSVNPSTTDSFQDNAHYYADPNSITSLDSTVIHIKEEDMAEEAIEGYSPEFNKADAQQTSTVGSDDHSNEAKCPSQVKILDDLHISGDKVNRSECDALWDNSLYSSSFDRHDWSELSHGCPSPHASSVSKSSDKYQVLGQGQPMSRKLTSIESTPVYGFSLNLPQPRRPATSLHKQFTCDIEGCTRSYYAKKNLLRHQTTIHGRVPTCRRPRHRSFFYPGTSY